MRTETITYHQQTFTLHHSGALYWHEIEMLLIADVHFGKVTHFRKHGSAIPQHAIQRNFEKLDLVLSHFRPKTLCFLGDLFHSYINSEWFLFEEWVKKKSSKIILISGNHDVISPLRYEEINVLVANEWQEESVLLTHIPENRAGVFNISGHIHPGIRLQGAGKQSISVPCFFKTQHQLILPAFGAFTGKHILNPGKDDLIFAIAEEEVIRVI